MSKAGFASTEADQTRLGASKHEQRLGVDAIAGSRVQDVQAKFRIHLGPMGLEKYESFLPPHLNNRRLRDWVRNYVGIEMDWDVELTLRADEVPRASLGGGARLWLDELDRHPKRATPANDLRLNPEKDSRRQRAS